jgi:Lipocalin-like domain
MKTILASIIAAVMICSGELVHAAALPVSNDLTGAWQLVSVETVRPNGEIIYPFYGKKPKGLIVYDPTGWMSVQIVSDPKPAVPTGNSRDTFKNAPAAEKAIAADGYYAYFGTYSIDVAASTVTHHLKESLYPGERGEDFIRHFSIEDGRLTLLTRVHEMGEEHQRRLIWERAAPGVGTSVGSSGAVAQSGALKQDDPTIVAGKNYKVVLENDQVRVLSFHAGPGEAWGLHAHPNAVVVSLDDYRVKNVIPGKEPTVRSARRGDVLWIPARSHTGENVGGSDMDCVLVELKGR